MKQMLSILFVMICFHTMAQKPMVVKPVITTVKPVASSGSATDNKYKTNPNQVELQKKATDRIQTEAERVDKLLAATLVEITTSADHIKSGYKAYYPGLRDLFKEIKFTIYAGSKGIIVEDVNSNPEIGNGDFSLKLKPKKTVTYKDLINQNVSFNIDLTKPKYDYFECTFYDFRFFFSDGTVVTRRLGSGGILATTFKTIDSDKDDKFYPELHGSGYFPANLFPDPRK